ncbi:DoxX family protein [Pseudomonas nunensis]|uniref:DoxX family protein n=1 Tax=Pseudomonas nunensis TaxID=2961896 RepID=A0ABY5ESI6_9PSED|nr:DoxX family protein [Pseudomonas nunensis]KPN91383.1 DoxX family protein [Pseudomonas nunensis]MCL5229949.1 DoxX family protein [Pseudomonas nunensis]UTO17660.1 DoxX family protein [Pseudomonas nunensis]
MSNKAFNQSASTSTALKYTSLGLRLIAALVFLAAGGAKLAGVPMMVEIFEHIGLGQWFRIATGLIEISAAVALFIPVTIGLGGLLLAITMCVAIFTHLFVIEGRPVPAILLLLITASIAWLHRDSTLSLIRRV